MAVNFLGYEEYLQDLEFDIIGPEAFYNKCLYLRKTESKYILRFLGIDINLTPVLYETMFELMENPNKLHRIVIDYSGNGAASDTARKRIERIRKAFLKAGITENIIVQINGKYKINLDVISEKYIITSVK